MQTLKRVVAVIVIVLSIIGIIVCVGGVLGAWTISTWVDVYRVDSTGANYILRKTFPLEG